MKASGTIFYIISDINKSLGFEWTARELQHKGLIVNWILLNKGNSALEEYLHSKGIQVYRIPFRGKTSMLLAIVKIIVLISKIKPTVVHTHLFDASICGLIAAWICRVPKRIVTRHHSTFHHDYFPRAVFYDRLIAHMATNIIAVSENVKEVLVNMENIQENKITVCPHGFDFNYFQNTNTQDVQQLKYNYELEDKYPVIGVIARYHALKGHFYIIEAFQKLLKNYPKACLILANARGSDEKIIKDHLKSLPKENYREIPFEKDLRSLYASMDLFIHCPINENIEAFGQIYVEALIMKIPSVFTLSGVAKEFIAHKKNALVVPFKNSEAIYHAMLRILNEKELAEQLASQGYIDVHRRYDIDQMIHCLVECYQ